jgi:corrinoid protein of di/trimethylamine methyltransferase
MSEILFTQLKQAVIDGDPEQAADLARQAVAAGVEPLQAINIALVPGIQHTGEQFNLGEMFLPDLMLAAEAMQQAMVVFQPELERRGERRQVLGRVVLGTVHGDIHEIGKNLVATMLSASGFEVFDLGVDVPVEKFIQKAQEVEAGFIGVSALLTTTMDGQREVVQAVAKAGLAGQVRVIVGGAPVTRAWTEQIGAAGTSEDASGAVALLRRLLAAA